MTQGATPRPVPTTLDYAGIDCGFRPAIVTALAICSIVFGSFGVLFNALHAIGAASELSATYQGGSPAPAIPGTAADTTEPKSLSPDEAKLIVEALAELQPLSEEERGRLEQAIQLVEAPLAPPLSGAWTTEHVRPQALRWTTRQPGELYTDEDGQTQTYEQREVHFDFGSNGDIWIYEDHIDVLAFPMDGRTVEGTVWDDGTIDVFDDDPFLWDLQLWLTLLAAAAATGLGVLLMIAGIQTLRNRHSGLRLHRVWAWLRIGVTIPALAIALWGTVQVGDFIGLGNYFWIAVAAGILLQLALTIAYPIVVLCLLRTKRVRAWQSGLVPNAGSPGVPTA